MRATRCVSERRRGVFLVPGVRKNASFARSTATMYATMKAANGGKQMRDMWTLLTPRKSEKALGGHPTQKPIALLERIVEASTNEDQVVLDPFCGSGTTGVAAVSKGRRFVGIEMDPNYLELSRKRIEAADRP